MLLQLSAKHGLNTDIVASWAVGEGYVIIGLSTGANVELNCDEGLEFLQYVTYSSSGLEVDTRNRLWGKERINEQPVKDAG